MHLEWMRDRHEILKWLDQFPVASRQQPTWYYLGDSIHSQPPSWSLFILGERTVRIIYVPFDMENMEIAEARVREVRRLFPEAQVSLHTYEDRTGPKLSSDAKNLWRLTDVP
jgi:hypothetical protein